MSMSTRARRTLATVAASALLVAGSLIGAAPANAAPPLPARMAALGDSITQASMSCAVLLICPANSWATGTSSAVASHASRLKALGAPKLQSVNVALPGADSADLAGQAKVAAALKVNYATVEIGANDACTSSLAKMTPTATFQQRVQAALTTLASSAGQPEIFVTSVPNLQRLYDLGKSTVKARLAWAVYDFCPTMLDNPTSTKPADVDRRAAVMQRVAEFNQVLAEACAATAKCTFDGGAVANFEFSASHISTKDYFHPSAEGQKALAALTWDVSPWG